jgi:putative nucleotidyltransferase with HDIG domain
MLKRVDVSQLQPGMYIHDLNCDWMSHPFLRQRFRIESDAQIAETGLREVYIDTDKGSDVSDAPTAAEVTASLQVQMEQAAEAPAPAKAASVGEELGRARKVFGEANRVVRSLMRDARLGNQVSLESVEPVVENVTASILRNGSALLSLTRIKSKDDYTFLHSVSVCALLVSFCRVADFDAAGIREAGIGGLLHDIGKMKTPDAILNKPGKLTDEEFAVMKSHAVESRNILLATPGISKAAVEVAGQHHERWDGSGYPDRLKGEQISRIGQMAAICDVYDAITSDRCYHKGMAPTEAMRKIFEWSRFHFNPDLTQRFMRSIGIYPVGSLVKLESGRLALVLEQGEGNLLSPKVRVIFDARHGHYLKPEDIELSRPMGKGGADRIVAHEDPAKWQIDPFRFL